MIKIEEVVTFIKHSKQEAILLAASLGEAEIHALHITNGFALAPKPVGYMVVENRKQKAAMATLERLGYTYHGGEAWKPPLGEVKEKNT